MKINMINKFYQNIITDNILLGDITVKAETKLANNVRRVALHKDFKSKGYISL